MTIYFRAEAIPELRSIPASNRRAILREAESLARKSGVPRMLYFCQIASAVTVIIAAWIYLAIRIFASRDLAVQWFIPIFASSCAVTLTARIWALQLVRPFIRKVLPQPDSLAGT